MLHRLTSLVFTIEKHIRIAIRLSTWCRRRIPLIGRHCATIIDRTMLVLYGIDMMSSSIAVRRLSISHPSGVLLGGNGLVSPGRVGINSGVKLVGRSPDDPEYLRRAREGTVFRFGDNVVIGANSVVIGPIDICDNVIISAMSLVNKSITEPGVYGGIPARKLKDGVPNDSWVAHL
jgi:serine acetyltransferase